jgi:lysophospholipase L1-like esterase
MHSPTLPIAARRRLPISLAALTLAAGCLRPIVEPVAKPGLVTTTPVTQDRDRAIYDWRTRHAEVLERNKTFKPDVVMFGDSITHYWGGEPKAPKEWAPEAWAHCFEGWKVTNMGFGWDRTENVLWRIENGELDGIEPKAVVVLIGTNNTAVGNSAEDIAAGIETICAAIHQKLPKSKVVLLGVLTRLDEKKPRPSATEKVNALLAARLSHVPWLYYCDFDSGFRQADGAPNVFVFMDGVHVNDRGYEILGAGIRAALRAIL